MSRFSILSERTFGGNKRYILFISTGNTCRAPMAYGVMKKLLMEANIEDLDIRTCGVMTVPGLMPTQECRQLLTKEGIDISTHRSCQLTPELIKRAALVLGMTSFHVQMALRLTDSARGKTFLLKEFAGFDGKNDQVQDPMGCTLEVYKKVFREIRNSCKRLMKCELVLSCLPIQQAQQVQELVAEAPAKKKSSSKSSSDKKKLEIPANECENKVSAGTSKVSRKESVPLVKAKKPAVAALKNGPASIRAAKQDGAVRRAVSAAKSARKS